MVLSILYRPWPHRNRCNRKMLKLLTATWKCIGIIITCNNSCAPSCANINCSRRRLAKQSDCVIRSRHNSYTQQPLIMSTQSLIVLVVLCTAIASAAARSGHASSSGPTSADLTANSLNTYVQQQQQKLAEALAKINVGKSDNSLGGPLASPSSHSSSSSQSSVPCTCGVFMSGQFDKGTPNAQPRGNAALMYEQDAVLPCTAQGNKQCTNRCLEMVSSETQTNVRYFIIVHAVIVVQIVKYLPNSPNIVCGTIDRDCHRERAYLFIQNCSPLWVNTKLSAGREYCCKGGVSVGCPLAALK